MVAIIIIIVIIIIFLEDMDPRGRGSTAGCQLSCGGEGLVVIRKFNRDNNINLVTYLIF